MNTLSSDHHQPKLLMKWKRTWTSDWAAACGIGMLTGPLTLEVVCSHTLVQVCPPSRLRSTSAVCPGNSLYHVSKLITGVVSLDKSSTGDTSEVSCELPGPYALESAMANWPSVPGGTPSLVGSAPNCQIWPLPALSTLVQPSCGVVPVHPVNPSVVPFSLKT